MLQAHVKFAERVGVAPGTTTMTLGQPRIALVHPTQSDMQGGGRGGGLGLVMPQDWWRTGDVGRAYRPGGTPVGLATQFPVSTLPGPRPVLPPAQIAGVGASAANLGGGLGYIFPDWNRTGRTGTPGTGQLQRYVPMQNPPENPLGYRPPPMTGTNVQGQFIPPAPLSGGLGFILNAERGGTNRTLIGGSLSGLSGQLGDIFTPKPTSPNDFELSRVYQYMPVHSGWTHTQAMSGALGDAATDEIVRRIAETEEKTYRLHLLSTLATVAVAGVALYRLFRGERVL